MVYNIIELCYWKLNEKAIPFEEKKDKLYWLQNNLYHFDEEEIIRSSTLLLNDHIIDAAQKLIYQELQSFAKNIGKIAQFKKKL